MSPEKRDKEPLDEDTRRRIAAWVRYKKTDLRKNQKELAALADVEPATISRLLNYGGPIGLPVFVKLTRNLRLNADDVLNKPPPGFRPGQPLPGFKPDQKPTPNG